MNKKNTALLVIDVINLCCHEKYDDGLTKIQKMVPRLVKFIKKYKENFGGQVIYITCVKWDKQHLTKNLNELYKNPKCCFYVSEKSNFSTEFYQVKPEKDDIIITKNNYDAFSNPKLDRILKNKKINNLVITGIFGDGCVEATIQSGFSKGYNFTILKDLIETTDEKIRQDLQKLLKKYTWPIMFGNTINSKDFLNIK